MNHSDSQLGWRWGAVRFDGVLGLRGVFLCFHKPLSENSEEVVFDPAKLIIPIEIQEGSSRPPYLGNLLPKASTAGDTIPSAKDSDL